MAGIATSLSGTESVADRAPVADALLSRTVARRAKSGVESRAMETRAQRFMSGMPWGLNARHLYLGFFSLISIALCAFSMVIYNQHMKVQNLNGFVTRQYEVIRQSRVVLTDVLTMETAVRGYVMTGDKSYLDPYATASAKVRDEVYALRSAMYYEPNSFAETRAWLDQIEGIQTNLEKQIAIIQQYGKGRVAPEVLRDEREAMGRLRQTLDVNNAERLQAVQAQIAAVGAQRSTFDYILIIGTIAGIGILLIGTVVIIRLEVANEEIEDESQRAQMRFRAVMNGVNDGLYEINFVNDTMYMSKEFKAMLGFAENEIEDTSSAATALIHPDDREQAFEIRRQYVTKQTPVYNNVFRMRHKDGTWRWIMSRGVGTWDRFGNIRSLIGTHTDITEQKTREEELRQLHADMEAFTYITSHDMRSPLVNLKGFSHELSMAVSDMRDLLEPQKDKLDGKTWQRLETTLKEDVPEAIGFIGNAVDRIDTLTTAILDLSRIGKYIYRNEKVNSQAVVDKVLGAQSYEIGNKQVEVTVGPLPEVVTDPLALEQVFSNLIDNAVKYLSPDRPGRIDISCVETARDFVFAVRDNGRGIEPADADRVFHIFRRARNTADVRGLGLGMAFVKATLRKLGGAIWFDSTVGEGTTFHVSLPRKTVKSAAPAEAEAAQ